MIHGMEKAVLSVFLACLSLLANATSNYPPPQMSAAIKWMIKENVSRACGQFLVTPGKDLKIDVSRSTGSKALDQVMIKSLVTEIQVLSRMELATFPFDKKGRRIVDMNIGIDEHLQAGKVLGCAPDLRVVE